MKIIQCDCAGCANTAKTMTKVTITQGESIREYDICNRCLCKLEQMFKGKQNSTEISEQTTDKETDYTELMDVKHKTKLQRAIDYYGEDRLRNDYIVNNRSIYELSAELGISYATLATYFRKNGIYKRAKRDKACETATEDD